MARYIDADKLCEALKSMASTQYPDKQNTILGVVSSIENFPTADVVPKSEFAKELIAEIAEGCATKDYNNIDISIGYATAMNDVLWHLTKIKQKYTEDINDESQNQT